MSRDPKKLRAHHDAWRGRLKDSGGVFLSLPLDHVYAEALRRLQQPGESRAECVRRCIAQAYNLAKG